MTCRIKQGDAVWAAAVLSVAADHATVSIRRGAQALVGSVPVSSIASAWWPTNADRR